MYQKCVCFLFLVILAILSCSGFRIDNLAMTDLTKKYPQTSDRHFRDAAVQRPHRIRHHRLWRTHSAHNRNAKPHIDAIVYPPSEIRYPKPDELRFAPDELRHPSETTFPATRTLSPPGLPRLTPSDRHEGSPSEPKFIWTGASLHPRLLPSEVKARSSQSSSYASLHLRRPTFPTDVNAYPIQPELPRSEVNPTSVQSGLSSSEVNSRSLRFGLLASEFISIPVRPRPSPSQVRSDPSEVSPDLSEVSSDSVRFGIGASEVTRARGAVSAGLTTLFPSETLAQIPPTDLVPMRALNSRSQRSSKNPRAKKNKKKAAWSSVQKEDFLGMAKHVKYAVLAFAESKNTNEPCSVYFVDISNLKNNTKLHLHSHRKMISMDCDKAKKLELEKQYLLLLDASFGLKQYRKSPKESFLRKVRKLDKKRFVVTKPEVVKLKETQKSNSTNRFLLCEVKGRPVPRITWWRNNEVLSSKKSYKIKYQKRKSKLIIRNATLDLMGEYICRAENLEGQVDVKNITLSIPFSEGTFTGKPCGNEYAEYCHNGGTCFVEKFMGELWCSCAEGFTGHSCDYKVPGDTSWRRLV